MIQLLFSNFLQIFMLMKNSIFFLFFFISTFANAQFNFQRSWGTYFGDERFEFSDSKVDSSGNLYIVGSIYGANLTNLLLFTNSSSYQQNYGGGDYDGFIVKFNPQGTIVWGTFFGGFNSDRIEAIDFDNNDNLYIIGETLSNSNIATTGSFQENLIGGGDNFISKFSSSGAIVWSTYFGGSGIDYSINSGKISFDGVNSIYISSKIFSPDLATPNVFQETISPNQISKFDLNGNRIWTTYYGINTIWDLKASSFGIFTTGKTNDCPPNHSYNTYYGTPNTFKPLPENCVELFLSKFNSNGQRIWSTYYGGSQGEGISINNSLDLNFDKIFIAGISPNYSSQEVATLGTYQSNSNGSSNFIAKFNQDSTRNWGTYNGNYNVNGGSLIAINSSVKTVKNENSFYNYGSTNIPSNIATSDGYLITLNNENSSDAYFCKFSDQNTKSWGTYYGGELNEQNIRFHPHNNESQFYIVGSTQSTTQIATTNGLQPNKQVFDLVNYNTLNAYNIFIAHFVPNALSNETLTNSSYSIYPNPNNGQFTVQLNSNDFIETSLEIFDMLGKKIYNQKLNSNQTTIYTKYIEKGVYLVKLTRGNQTTTSKIVIN